jgi:hypothetical protein
MKIADYAPGLTKYHSSSSVATKIDINFQLAQSILSRLGYELEEIDIHGDGNGSGITHHLFYGSIYNTANIMGYVSCEHGIYYAKPENNHRTAELAALELLDEKLVQATAIKILDERQALPDYF